MNSNSSQRCLLSQNLHAVVSSRSRGMAFLFTICVLLICSPKVLAAELSEQDSSVKVSGFGTFGVSYNSSGEFDYLRDLLQTRGVGYSRRLDIGLDSLVGLQLSTKLSDSVETTAQTVIRPREGNYRPELTWGFIKYYPNDEWDFRLGRLGFDVYPLADSRNVAYSYVWVRPPVEYFGGLIVSYIDGVDAVYQYSVGNGQAKAKLFAGKAQERLLAASPDTYFSLKNSKIIGAQLEFQSQNWLARIGLAELQFNHQYPGIQGLIDTLQSPMFSQLSPAAGVLAENLSFKDKKIRYLSAGLVYDNGPLQAQLMLSRLNSQTLSFNSNVAGFFTIAYRVKEWTPYFTYAEARPSGSKNIVTGLPLTTSPMVDQIEAGVQSFLKTTRNEQHSQSIGLRYSLNQTSDIKIQVDMINNKERLLVRQARAGWNGKGTIISCNYNFIFN
jgi:hypothetical protein